MWKRLVAVAVLGALLDWGTTAYALSTGLYYEMNPSYSPFFALTLLPSLTFLAARLGRLCRQRLRLAYTVLAYTIAGCGYIGAVNNTMVLLQLA